MPTVHTITYSFKSRAGRVYRNVIILNWGLISHAYSSYHNLQLQVQGWPGLPERHYFKLGIDFSCLQFIP